MDDSSPAVIAEQARRMSQLDKRLQRQAESGGGGGGASSDKWIQNHMTMAETMSIQYPLEHPLEFQKAPFFQTLTAREQEAA